MKKIALSFICFIFMFSILETGARFYVLRKIAHINATPYEPETLRNYEGFLEWAREIGVIQDALAGSAGIYTPYTAVWNRPNYRLKIHDFDLEYDSLGFRAPEIVTPKPKGVFRVFLLGGSTVAQGLNDNVTISHAVQKELRKTIPTAEVINAGVTGYASDNELILLETEILSLQPDMVIVLDGTNDIFYADNPSISPASQEKRLLNTVVNWPTFYSPFAYATKTVLRRSRLVTLIFREIFHRHLPRNFSLQTKFNDNRIQVYLRDLRLMQAALETARVQGILAFQPTLAYCKDHRSAYEQTIVEYMTNVEKVDWFEKADKIWPAVGKRVISLPPSSSVKFYDLSCLFANDEKSMYADNIHYTPRGSQRIGETFAKIIHNFSRSKISPKALTMRSP